MRSVPVRAPGLAHSACLATFLAGAYLMSSAPEVEGSELPDASLTGDAPSALEAPLAPESALPDCVLVEEPVERTRAELEADMRLLYQVLCLPPGEEPFDLSQV